MTESNKERSLTVVVGFLFFWEVFVLIEILKGVLQSPERPNPYEPYDNELYMRRKQYAAICN